MNRKLLNGLLVLAVAAGGVGTFTSCKDENFSNPVESLSLQAQLDAIRQITDTQFQANLDAYLQKWLNNWTASASSNGFSSYDEMVQAANAMNQIYQSILSDTLSPEAEKYVQALYNWMFKGGEITKNDWYDMIVALANRASSVELNQTINPVFGSVNLPIGLKTTVLASYLYKGDATAEYMFPTQVRDVQGGMSHLALNFAQIQSNIDALNTIQTLAAGKAVELKNGTYTMGDGYGSMGAAYVNINPSSLDFAGSKNVQLVNSKDEVLLDAANGDLVVENNQDLLSFGTTRDDQTGVYKVNANVSSNFAENGGVTIDFDDAKDFVSDVKAAIKDRTISNIAYVGEQLYKRVNNLLPAYALKVWWEEPVMGTEGYTGTTVNSVRSAYDIAAAVIHPLSYGTPMSDAFGQAGLKGKHLPTFSSLEYYLDKIQNKLTINVGKFDSVDDVKIEFEVKIEDGKVIFTYPGPDGYDITGEADYDADGIQVSDSELTSFVNAVLEACNYELSASINEQIVKQINDAIDDINKQVQDLVAQMGSFSSYIDRIKNSSKLEYADKLVDVYNRFATYVNKFLANPDHYLQVAMIYSDGAGHYHHLSTDSKCPTYVDPAKGDAIELLATSYTGDVVVPSYAKYVAITKVNNREATVDDNAKGGEMLNVVLPGVTQRVPVKVSGFNKGDVLKITYLSVDYHGLCSMRNYYVKVK